MMWSTLSSRVILSTLRPFEHASLENPKEQIRLAKLTIEDGIVKCSLVVFDLIDAPEYCALSYVWGEASSASKIRIGDKSLSIRKNLGLFLEEILKASELRNQFFWVDQICIKQDDLNEKNEQVKLMGTIYTKAKSVLAWLGKMDRLEQDDLLRRFRGITSPSTPSSDLEMLAITFLLRKEYFSRVWTKQELLLAKEASIMVSAGNCISWSLVRSIGLSASESYVISQETFPGWSLIEGSRYEYPREDPSSCMLLLGKSQWSESQCSDPRDMVYGILGLIDQTLWPEVDYAKSPQQVVLDAVLMLWRSTFKFCEQHTSSCYSALEAWHNAEKAITTLQRALDARFERFDLFTFSRSIARWGAEHREDIITDMGFEENERRVLIRRFASDANVSSGGWWFKAGGKVYWDEDEKTSEYIRTIAQVDPFAPEIKDNSLIGQMFGPGLPRLRVHNPDAEDHARRPYVKRLQCEASSGTFCVDLNTFEKNGFPPWDGSYAGFKKSFTKVKWLVSQQNISS